MGYLCALTITMKDNGKEEETIQDEQGDACREV